MNDFQELLVKANNNDYASLRILIENSSKYYDEIIEAAEANTRRIPRGLKAVLENLSDDIFLDKLLELSTSKTPFMSIIAFKAISNFSNKKVLLFLQDKLVPINEYSRYRHSSIQALGDSRLPQARQILLSYTKDIIGDPHNFDALDNLILDGNPIEIFNTLGVYLELLKSLRKHGDQSYSAIVPFLLKHSLWIDDDYNNEKEIIWRQCISDLLGTYVDDLIPVILKTMQHEFEPWKNVALLALQYLGSKEAVDALIQLIDFSHQETSEIAYESIKLIIGIYPNNITFVEDTNKEEVALWWNGIKKNYETNVVYRNGVPRSLPQLVDLFLNKKEHVQSVYDEIQYTYGLDLKPLSHTDVIDQTHLTTKLKMLSENSNFQAGVLYKYGYKIHLD